jgi:hypothetical protein
MPVATHPDLFVVGVGNSNIAVQGLARLEARRGESMGAKRGESSNGNPRDHQLSGSLIRRGSSTELMCATNNKIPGLARPVCFFKTTYSSSYTVSLGEIGHVS